MVRKLPAVNRFPDAAAWADWLDGHHADDGGAWLLIARKGSSAPLITIDDAAEVAMCYGWIDGHRRAYDDRSFLQRYSRRRPGSTWSQVNVVRAEVLIATGRMRPPGLRAVEAARADGRWDAAYAPQRSAPVPAELSAALAEDAGAANRFAALDRTARYLLVLPLLKARTPAAKARRQAEIMATLRR
ncbi:MULTISPECIES: YdeI/OmpD-associated family protein [Nocardia]|uniref:YdeI family protein n=1 Tax=Nocardia elegans TaxID=300029 RepID=A0ABW6T8D3_9NOCA|nr:MULTISPECIES: YdeI/OmpD-associated family protein [Nocardia]